jgi:hypothetical protein
MSDIFVSYSSKDKERVGTLVKVLEQWGWSVWWDPKILHGSQFDETIEAELKSAKCVIVVWSTTSVSSHWVKEEAHEGADRSILIPVLIDDVAIPLGFRLFDAAGLIDWQGDINDEELQNLRISVSNLVPPAPKSKRKKESIKPTSVEQPHRPTTDSKSGSSQTPPATIENLITPRPHPKSESPQTPHPATQFVSPMEMLKPRSNIRQIGYGADSAAQRRDMFQQWRASPEYEARAAARARAENQRLIFYRSIAWWLALILWPLACIMGLKFCDNVTQYGVALFVRNWQSVRFNPLTLSITGLAWGLTYSISAAKNSYRWWHVFAQPFLPYYEVLQASDFEERRRGLLAAWPLNSLLSLSIARVFAYFMSVSLAWFGVTLSTHGLTNGVAMYSVFIALNLTGLASYLLDLDEYDLDYSFNW